MNHREASVTHEPRQPAGNIDDGPAWETLEGTDAPPTPLRGVAREDVQSGQPGTTSASPSNGLTYVVWALVGLSVVVLCAIGVMLGRLFVAGRATPTPVAVVTQATPISTSTRSLVSPTPLPASTPGQPWLAVDPGQGYIGTLVTVYGGGWWEEEPVFFFLQAPGESEEVNFAYAAAVADADARFEAVFTFPNEARWLGKAHADVVARGTRSGLEVRQRFVLVPPTATSTSTPMPTRPSTQTPSPSQTPVPSQTPTETPIVASPTPQVVITEWRGEYFDNPTLSASPKLVRNDTKIDFGWGEGAPDASLPADGFSVRWSRQLRFSEGLYRFSVTVDDGVRLWFDGQLLIDEWRDGGMTTYSVDRMVGKGRHDLRVEYYENLGAAIAQFTLEKVEIDTATPTPTWTSTSTATPTPTPSATATQEPTVQPATDTATPEPTTPPASSALPTTWRGEYYDNVLFMGSPVLVRDDAKVDFSWGEGSPAEGLPADGFGVRWAGEVWMVGGTYRYMLDVDDGARVWIDEQLVIDAWLDLSNGGHMLEVGLPEGTHAFRVEYQDTSGNAEIHLLGSVAP